MLSPDYLYHVSDRAIELYEQLNSFAVRDICRRLVNADFQFTGSIDWQMYKLQQSGMLLDDIVAEVAKITKKSEKEIAEIFEEATYKSQSYDNDVYKRAGLTPIDIRQSPQMLKILQATYEQTMGEIRNFTRTTASACQSLFLETMDEVSFRVLSGQQSYTEAVRQAINTVSSAGLQIRYPSGHIDTIETAVRRCVITGVGQATARVSIQNAQEMDTDLVLVSSHLGARPSHAEWQGKVYSISGNSKKYSKLSDATGYGTVSGLCGANCRHHFMPYIDGVSTNPYEKFDSKENQKRYDDLQEQRRQERGIRSTKRELQATKESIDATKDDKLKFALQQDYDRKAEKLKAQRDAYDEFSQKAGLPTQAERLQVSGVKNVAKQSGSDIIKSITLDDFEVITSNRGFDKKALDCIYDTIKEYEEENLLYISDLLVGSLDTQSSGVPILQIEPMANGLHRLNINKDVFENYTFEEINSLIRDTKINVSKDLHDAVVHECGHAKLIKGLKTSEVRELYKELKDLGVSGISKIALDDGVECIAETEVLLKRGEKVPKEALELYNRYIRRYK